MHIAILSAALALLGRHVQAHGGEGGHHYEEIPVPEGATWDTRHMIEEHHIQYFDPGSFFSLHDFDGNGEWSRDEIMRFYGMQHESNNHVAREVKEHAAERVVEIFDRDRSGGVSYSEYVIGVAQGLQLPDLGYGPGHHGDDEYEYEIHHFEKYHGDDATMEDMIHPEDIEHFRMHDLLDEQMERQEIMDQTPLHEENIPRKFWRD